MVPEKCTAFCAITRRHLSGLRNHAVPVFSSDEDLTVELTVEQKDFLDLFSVLPSEQQKALIAFLRTLKADLTE